MKVSEDELYRVQFAVDLNLFVRRQRGILHDFDFFPDGDSPGIADFSAAINLKKA
ncbi:MAG: hypothetical protein HGA70_01685 [Chlorobiaceae bacterium]|nr:hypothetical protein [Chlorobiaceae bacterium]NTW11539.1 hypothetical protein [Chlorobiaceae bacterium]